MSDAKPTTDADASPMKFTRRILILLPVLILALAVSLLARNGHSLIDAMGHNPPPPDQFLVTHVDFVPGSIKIVVTNPQRQKLTIATVTVDDLIMPFTINGDTTMGRLGSRTITVPFTWVNEDPYVIGVTSSSGIETKHDVAAAVARTGPTGTGIGAGAILGFLVGILPVGLGLAWLPWLRRMSTEWLVAFLSLTIGLLVFVALDAFAEVLNVQTRLPSAISGPGTILLAVATSYLGISWLSHRSSRKRAEGTGAKASQGGLRLAVLVAVGIGLHNLGEGLAIGSSFALGELSLGVFLITGFMIHNITEGLGIAVPATASPTVRIVDGVMLTLIAGTPAIFGIWIGRYITNDLIAVVFFSFAVGAALQVVTEVGRYSHRLSGGKLLTSWSIGGFLAGISIMYVTGIFAS